MRYVTDSLKYNRFTYQERLQKMTRKELQEEYDKWDSSFFFDTPSNITYDEYSETCEYYKIYISLLI